MHDLALGSLGLDDLNDVFSDAWTEFTAAIDLVAQASLRETMAARIMRAAQSGEVSCEPLRKCPGRQDPKSETRFESFETCLGVSGDGIWNSGQPICCSGLRRVSDSCHRMGQR
jgi:hypothetical protein